MNKRLLNYIKKIFNKIKIKFGHLVYLIRGCDLSETNDLEELLASDNIFIYGGMCNSFWCGFYMNRCGKKYNGFFEPEIDSGVMCNEHPIFNNKMMSEFQGQVISFIIPEKNIENSLLALEKISSIYKIKIRYITMIYKKAGGYEFNINRFLGYFRNILLKDDSMTIISNDCTAGRIYEALGISAVKSTPTVNVIITDEDFIKLCSDPQKYLNSKVIPINILERPCLPEGYSADKNSEIGKIHDIKVIFRHNYEAADVYYRWNNALNNVKLDNLIVVYSDGQRAASYNLFKTFECIDARKLIICSNGFYRGKDEACDYLTWDANWFFNPDIPIELHFDLLGWINGIMEKKGGHDNG